MSLVVLGHHQQAGGVLVQAVDDAGAQLTADAGKVMDMIQQGIDQRAVLVAGGGVYHHALGLVQHGDVCILIHDAQRQRLGTHLGLPHVGEGCFQHVPGLYRGLFGGRTTVDGDSPFPDQSLGSGTGERGKDGEGHIQPCPGLLRRDGEGHGVPSFPVGSADFLRASLRAMTSR